MRWKLTLSVNLSQANCKVQSPNVITIHPGSVGRNVLSQGDYFGSNEIVSQKTDKTNVLKTSKIKTLVLGQLIQTQSQSRHSDFKNIHSHLSKHNDLKFCSSISNGLKNKIIYNVLDIIYLSI